VVEFVTSSRQPSSTRLRPSSRYTSAISVYKGLNGIKNMQPLSDTDILLEYTLAPGSRGKEELTDGADAVKIMLSYDPETKTLARAKVSWRIPSFSAPSKAVSRRAHGADVRQMLNHVADIEEIVSVAVQRNDVPGLIADILTRLRSP